MTSYLDSIGRISNSKSCDSFISKKKKRKEEQKKKRKEDQKERKREFPSGNGSNGRSRNSGVAEGI